MSTKNLNEWLAQLNQDKVDLGLDRIKTAFDRLNLQQNLPQVITVGGTNGKGSTVAALSALGQAHGLTVGTFTSPHLVRYNERIKINDVVAGDEAIVAAFEKIKSVSQDINLSYFEYAALAALLIFKGNGVDLIVLEVGLGGRLDATNVVDAQCCIITTVDLDHMSVLGNDREQIGFEKAGIMRKDTPVIFASSDCPQSILNHANDIGAVLLRFDQDYRLEKESQGYSYHRNKTAVLTLQNTNVQGDWQYHNIAAAITALTAIGMDLNADQIAHAIQNIRLSGRLHSINQQPHILLDVAHNNQSVEKLTEWLKQNPCEGTTRAVFSVLEEKQAEHWLPHIDAVVDHWFISEIKDSERGIKQSELLTLMAEKVQVVSAFDSLSVAYDMAVACSQPQDRVVVFGSFYVLSEIYQHLATEIS